MKKRKAKTTTQALKKLIRHQVTSENRNLNLSMSVGLKDLVSDPRSPRMKKIPIVDIGQSYETLVEQIKGC